MIRIERPPQRRAHLEADQVAQRDAGAVGRLGLGTGQGGGEQWHAGMSKQREVRVVEVVRVTGGAVGERGPRGGRP